MPFFCPSRVRFAGKHSLVCSAAAALQALVAHSSAPVPSPYACGDQVGAGGPGPLAASARPSLHPIAARRIRCDVPRKDGQVELSRSVVKETYRRW